MRELSRRKVLDGIFAYGEYVFGYLPAAHHKEMVGLMLDAVSKAGTDQAENLVVLEPRGHAKTTWGNTITLSWLIAQFPHLRVGLMSKTSSHADDFSRAIRWTYESNPRHREIFGNLVSTAKWTDAEWLVKDSPWQGSKDVTLYAQGAGGQLASKRFDVILCDDILDEKNTATPEQRELIRTWFWKTLKPCLTPNGVIIVLGTRWAQDDLYQELLDPIEKGGKGWRSVIRQAITVSDNIRQPLWPEAWPLDRLDAERADMGTPFFSCAYNNDVTGMMEGNIFQSANFQWFNKLDPDKTYTVKMGVDLASSERETADYTARAIVATDNDGNYYVMSVYRDRRSHGHARFIYDGWMAAQDMALVIVENNQFQSTLVQEVLTDFPSIPIEGKKSDVDKVSRARAVAAKYEGKRVWHHRTLKDSDFEIELKSFPKGHDDMVDALGFAMDLGGDTFIFSSVRR